MFLTRELFRLIQKSDNLSLRLITDDSIPFNTVRVLKDRKFLGDYLLKDAIEKAKSYDKTLILFKPRSNPPICIIDSIDQYSNIYNGDKLENEKSLEFRFDPCQKLKQIHISNMCSDTDFERKINQAYKFLDNGYRIEIVLITKGGPSSISKSTKIQTRDLYPTKIHRESELNIAKNADRLVEIARDRNIKLSYSTENPLILRIDRIYSLLQGIGRPYTIKSKIVSSITNQRQIVVKFFPIGKSSE